MRMNNFMYGIQSLITVSGNFSHNNVEQREK